MLESPGSRVVVSAGSLIDELGHSVVSGEDRLMSLEDGSTWWVAQDLLSGRKWVGERVG